MVRLCDELYYVKSFYQKNKVTLLRTSALAGRPVLSHTACGGASRLPKSRVAYASLDFFVPEEIGLNETRAQARFISRFQMQQSGRISMITSKLQGMSFATNS